MAFWNKEKIYHYNPKTGEVSRCRAKSPESCPFGAENHSKDIEQLTYYADVQNQKKARIERFGLSADKILKSGGGVEVHFGKDWTGVEMNGNSDRLQGTIDWLEKYQETHSDKIENFDEAIRDLNSVNLVEVDLCFKNSDDTRSLKELGFEEFGPFGELNGREKIYYRTYTIPNVDGRGNDAYMTIGRLASLQKKVHSKDKDDRTTFIYYYPDIYGKSTDLYEKVFEKTKGDADLDFSIDRDNFINQCVIWDETGGRLRELYRKYSQEVFKDLYNDRLYDIESEYGEDSNEVGAFKKSLESVTCLDRQSVIDSGYTSINTDTFRLKDTFSDSVLEQLKVDREFVKDAMWSRIRRDILTPPDEGVLETSEDGSFMTKDMAILKVSKESEDEDREDGRITIFTL